jgi:hypothetical protein
MTDLPERLRRIAETVDDWNAPITARDDLTRAADEIERLRAMTDPSQLAPGPELDAIIAEILGWTPREALHGRPENPAPCLDGTGEE